MDKRDTRSSERWHGLLTEDHQNHRMILSLDAMTSCDEDFCEWSTAIPGTDNRARLDADRVALPARFAVCNTCDGSGSHVNPNIDRNGLDPNDPDLDPDFWADYRSGTYDVRCNLCEGRRVVMVLDDGPGPLHELVVMVLTEVEDRDEAAYEWHQEERAERRACGYEV